MKRLIILHLFLFFFLSMFSQSFLTEDIPWYGMKRDIKGLEKLLEEFEFYSMNDEIMKLPEPDYVSNTSIEKALLDRRSVRAYSDASLDLNEVSQLLWAAQGINDPGGRYRTAPSAGALYPLEIYVVAGRVEGVAQGVYKYKPHQHEMVLVRDGNVRNELTAAALGQSCVGSSAVAIVISAVYERTTQKYGERGIRYVHMEAGHAAQNVYLQSVSLNLGMVAVGAFRDDEVRKALNMPAGEQPLYILPIGKK